MPQEIKTEADAIDALGGEGAISAAFGWSDVRRVWNWRDRGIPRRAYEGIATLLLARDLKFSSELFQRQYSYPINLKRYLEYLNNGNRE